MIWNVELIMTELCTLCNWIWWWIRVCVDELFPHFYFLLDTRRQDTRATVVLRVSVDAARRGAWLCGYPSRRTHTYTPHPRLSFFFSFLFITFHFGSRLENPTTTTTFQKMDWKSFPLLRQFLQQRTGRQCLVVDDRPHFSFPSSSSRKTHQKKYILPTFSGRCGFMSGRTS